MSELGIWVITILTFLLGYFAGIVSKFDRQDILNTYSDAKGKFNDSWPFHNKKRIGAIPTPTQQEIYLRDNPKIKEETEEMKGVFSYFGVDKVKPNA